MRPRRPTSKRCRNEQLLRGNREILDHVDRLEHQIIDLEKRILERLEHLPN